MSIASQATKHVISVYRELAKATELTQAKLEALLTTNPNYSLFIFEHKDHPYYGLVNAAQSALDAYLSFVASAHDWQLSASTIGEQLDNLKARQIVDELEADSAVDGLVAVTPCASTVAEIALKLAESISLTYRLRDYSKNIKDTIKKKYGAQNLNRHIENPEMQLAPNCAAAAREMKKLVKLRIDVDGERTIRQELTIEKTNLILSSLPPNRAIDLVLAL